MIRTPWPATIAGRSAAASSFTASVTEASGGAVSRPATRSAESRGSAPSVGWISVSSGKVSCERFRSGIAVLQAHAASPAEGCRTPRSSGRPAGRCRPPPGPPSRSTRSRTPVFDLSGQHGGGHAARGGVPQARQAVRRPRFPRSRTGGWSARECSVHRGGTLRHPRDGRRRIGGYSDRPPCGWHPATPGPGDHDVPRDERSGVSVYTTVAETVRSRGGASGIPTQTRSSRSSTGNVAGQSSWTPGEWPINRSKSPVPGPPAESLLGRPHRATLVWPPGVECGILAVVMCHRDGPSLDRDRHGASPLRSWPPGSGGTLSGRRRRAST